MTMALDPITAGLGLGDRLLSFGEAVINRIWPDPTVREEHKLKLAELAQNGELQRLAAQTGLLQAQIETNRAEAASSSMFVAGWRPAIGWTCASALAWQFVVAPIGAWAASIAGYDLPTPPTLDGMLWELLLGMLGIGFLRTVEKVKGVAR